MLDRELQPQELQTAALSLIDDFKHRLRGLRRFPKERERETYGGLTHVDRRIKFGRGLYKWDVIMGEWFPEKASDETHPLAQNFRAVRSRRWIPGWVAFPVDSTWITFSDGQTDAPATTIGYTTDFPIARDGFVNTSATVRKARRVLRALL